jgi:CBS domain containing-hemolysin-like protein
MVTIFVVSTLVAVVFSFFCSLAEAVLLSLSPIRLETRRMQGDAHAAAWLRMRQNVSRPIAAILVLNTIAHTGGATIAGGAFEDAFGARWLWAFSVVFTLVILFGTEILPKTLGVRYNEQVARWLTAPMRVSLAVLHPLVVVAERLSRAVAHTREEPGVTTDDLQTLAKIARSKGLIAGKQESIIVRALALRETNAGAAMIPRDWIVYLKGHAPVRESLEIARRNFHTRYPVSEGESVDDLVGYVNLKEVLATEPEPRSLFDFLRPLLFVSPETTLEALLRLFVGGRHHLAVVKDRSGKILGMVTLEDVLEELVGEIEDEFDFRPVDIVQLGPRRWRVGGGVRLSELSKRLDVAFEDPGGDPTLAEWVSRRARRPLSPGWSGTIGPVRVVARQVRRGQAHQTIVELSAPVDPRGEPG